ncbi:hypothetical protein [Roseomonas chloroacetimidivorans]|uniref:hypothetical protein n=1 Tax=Roseomonas chloroacetimidivorans TaxID=1766656 RepID=UPI003C783134
MSGSRLNMLASQLIRIHGRVHQVRLDAVGEAKAPGANEAAPTLSEARAFALGVKLRPILNDLALVQRELKVIGDGLDLRERIAVRVPAHLRYREAQSVASGRQHHRQIFQLLCEIVDDLVAIWGGRGPSERELMEAAADAVKSTLEFQQALTSKANEFRTVLGSSNRLSSIRSAQTVQNVSFEGLAVLAWLIVYAIMRRSPMR